MGSGPRLKTNFAMWDIQLDKGVLASCNNLKYTTLAFLSKKKRCLIIFVPSRLHIIDIIGFWTLCLKGDTSYCHFIHHPCQFTLQIYSLTELTLDCPPTGREAETWTKLHEVPGNEANIAKLGMYPVPSNSQGLQMIAASYFFGVRASY